MNKIGKKVIISSKFCSEIFDGTHDSPKYYDKGYPLVTSKHISSTSIDFKNAPLIDENDFNKINKRSLVKENDVLVSMIGTVGTIAYIKDKPNFAIKNIGVLRAYNKIDAKYLYFYMQSPTAQFQIKSGLEGSTQPFFSLYKLRNFPIVVPIDEAYKQHIVDTIGSVDELIENLEEQIDVIKKSLRSFYLSFQFNGVIKKMGNCFKITIGKTPPTKERKWFTNDSRAGIKWLSIKDMKDNGDYIFSTSKHLTSQAQSEFNIPLVQKGDILLSFKLTLGRVGISTLNMITNEAIACFKYDQTYMPYLYCFLSNYNFEKKIESTSSM